MPANHDRTHFVGVAGVGMSALALYLTQAGCEVTGSDRALDQGSFPDIREKLEKAGIRVVPQDGRGVSERTRVITSTAVEAEIPDLVRARDLSVELLHRSELLGLLANSAKTLAITGTNGKSTVVGMIFQILRDAGLDPSVITGGALLSLESPKNIGNAHRGKGPLVIEADESDKSLVRYTPEVGVILNLERDHDEPEAFMESFQAFCHQTSGRVVIGPGNRLDRFRQGALSFGLTQGTDAAIAPRDINIEQDASHFTISMANENPVAFTVNQPGAHNLANGVAAISACVALGVPLSDCRKGLAAFDGLHRRLQRTSPEDSPVEVFDDFAHNPWKIAAAVQTACSRGERVWAVFQPHGFAPARLMRDELVRQLHPILRPDDHFILSEIYYAGGAARKTLSSKDMVDDLVAAGVPAHFGESHRAICEQIRTNARPGDVVLIMGARDPGLSQMAHELGGAFLRE